MSSLSWVREGIVGTGIKYALLHDFVFQITNIYCICVNYSIFFSFSPPENIKNNDIDLVAPYDNLFDYI